MICCVAIYIRFTFINAQNSKFLQPVTDLHTALPFMLPCIYGTPFVGVLVLFSD